MKYRLRTMLHRWLRIHSPSGHVTGTCWCFRGVNPWDLDGDIWPMPNQADRMDTSGRNSTRRNP